MLPEEQELARMEAEQAELEEQVTSAELALETSKTEAAQFQQRYYQAVGRLYAQLDELDAQIAKAQMELAPNDAALKAHAYAAERRAQRSAQEAGLIESQAKPPPTITVGLKQAYRQAVKLMHPDLATTEDERKRRTGLMAQVNLAYERGDLSAIEKLIREYGEDPEAVIGEDVASRIFKTIRRIAQLRRRLGELHQEVEAQQKNEICQLKRTIEEAERRGDDPLTDLTQQLMEQIAERKKRLDKSRQHNAKQASKSEAGANVQSGSKSDSRYS